MRFSRLSLEHLESRCVPTLFGSASSVATGWGGDPYAPVLADVNGDGDLDLACISSSFSVWKVTIREGNGDGTFGSLLDTVALGTQVVDAAFADVDGDSDRDLLMLAAITDQLVVWTNNGSGDFSASNSYSTESSPASLEIGDFDENGDTDVLVHCVDSENTYDDEVQVFLGATGATFGDPTDLNLGNGFFRSLTVGDIDGDADLDFAIIQYGTQNPNVAVHNLKYRLGNGDGTFASQSSFDLNSTEGAPDTALIADLDGDGDGDLVTAGELNQDEHGILSYLWGGSSFGSQSEFESDFFTEGGMVVADFDSDGNLDIALVCEGDSDSVNVFLGNGDGTFDAHDDYATGNGPRFIAVGDLDGDGKPDLVTANQDDDNLSVLINAL